MLPTNACNNNCDCHCRNRFDSMDAVMMLTEADMESLGVKTGHRRLLMSALNDTKNRRRQHNNAGLPGSPATLSNPGDTTNNDIDINNNGSNTSSGSSSPPMDLPPLGVALTPTTSANNLPGMVGVSTPVNAPMSSPPASMSAINHMGGSSSSSGMVLSPRRLEPLGGGTGSGAATPTSHGNSTTTSPVTHSNAHGTTNTHTNGGSLPSSPRTSITNRLVLPAAVGSTPSSTTTSSLSNTTDSKMEKRSGGSVSLPPAVGGTTTSSISAKGDSPPAVVTINLPPLRDSSTPPVPHTMTTSGPGTRSRDGSGAGDALPLVVARRSQAKRDGGADEFAKGTALETGRPRPDWKGAFAHFCRAMAQGCDQAILKVHIDYTYMTLFHSFNAGHLFWLVW
jgi:hypothetical protein